MLDADDDAVAVHRLIEVAAGDVDARGPFVAGRLAVDEPEAARVGRHAPDHEVHPIRQAEPLAADLDQLSAGDQPAQACA